MADNADGCNCSHGIWWHAAQHFLAFYTLLTLCSGGFIGMLFIDVNRQAFLWTRKDTVYFFVSLGVLALICTIILTVVNVLTKQKAVQWGSHLIFLVLSVIAVQLTPPRLIQAILPDDIFYAGLLVLGLGLSVWSTFHPRNRMKPALWSLVHILALIPLLLFANLLAFPTLSGGRDIPLTPFVSADISKPPVIIFTFDSIASIDCMDSDGNILPELPFMKSFQNMAINFSAAISPGKCTMISTPNFLFQRDPAQYGKSVWQDEFLQEDPLSFTNGLYYTAKQHGYRASFIGEYLPYKQMLRGLLDYAYILPFESYTVSQCPLPRFRHYLLCVLKYLRGPFPERAAGQFPHLQYTNHAHRQYYVKMNRKIQTVTKQFFLYGLSHQDFSVVDIPIPHFPFVFMPDGTYGEKATYATQLEYVDRIFGAFMQDLRQSNIYDLAWVIFTSDHGQDSTRNMEKDHVPLLIKPPKGTYQAQRIDKRIRMWEMGPFFQAVFQGKPTEECLAFLPGDVGFDVDKVNE